MARKANKSAATGAPHPAKDEGAGALEAALAAVPSTAKPPKVELDALPALVFVDGRVAPPEIVGSIVRAGTVEGFLAGSIGRVARDAFTKESADAFAAAIFELWREKEFHGRNRWMGEVAVALGGDRVALAIEPLVVAWSEAGDTGRERSKSALHWLRRIGTDTALLVLVGLRHKVLKPSVIEAAIDVLEAAASDRRTTVSELRDRITPTLGLDQRGARDLDYGGRRFTLALDAHFEPSLRDESGALLDALPPPEATDDPALVHAARVAFDVLSGQLREAVKVQSYRLEQDMIVGRRWSAPAWTRALKEHPLLVNFTRRLLWGMFDAKDALVATFRTAEDQTLVDIEDRTFVLPDRASVGVVHPLHVDDGARAAWSRHFEDYEIIQPFPQLGREFLRPTADELEAEAVERFAGEGFKSGVIRDTLVRRGWERDPSAHRRFYRRIFAGVAAYATLDPGVPAGYATYDTKDQTIPVVHFKKGTEKRMSTKPMAIRDVPPVAFSEALLDLREVLVEQDSGPG